MSTGSSEILLVNPSAYFSGIVDDALEDRKFTTYPLVRTYIIDLLTHFILTDNLWDETDSSGKKTREMLSESYFRANGSEPRVKIKKLKELGDHSLYVSGFFADSLQRKIVDVDYYVDMGRAAYETLATTVDEDTFSKLYREISTKFIDLVDVLSFISKKSMMTNEKDLLRLMDIYSKTGSPLAGETLIGKGCFNLPIKKQMKNEQ